MAIILSARTVLIAVTSLCVARFDFSLRKRTSTALSLLAFATAPIRVLAHRDDGRRRLCASLETAHYRTPETEGLRSVSDGSSGSAGQGTSMA